ncbi:hypothetical protein M405DRAFT_65416 [Rhizopogon salebrosus TDB-379]|nr:hypothetical protein M405DRAFT_65416 [Rhizopogon salebrosus TDB-379]
MKKATKTEFPPQNTEFLHLISSLPMYHQGYNWLINKIHAPHDVSPLSPKMPILRKSNLEKKQAYCVCCGATTPARLTNVYHFLELPTMRPSLGSSYKASTTFSSAIQDARVGVALMNALDGASHVVLCTSSRVCLPVPSHHLQGCLPHSVLHVVCNEKVSREGGALNEQSRSLKIDDGRPGPDII